MSAQPKQQTNPSQSSSQPSSSQQSKNASQDASKKWDAPKDAANRPGGMKDEPTSQNRDQFRSDPSKK